VTDCASIAACRHWKIVTKIEEQTVRSGPPKTVGVEEELRFALRAGRYDLGRKLGTGGMGTVYEARHVLLDRPAAIKVLSTLTAANRAAFLDEGRSLAKLRHPHIVEIYDLDVVAGVPYMVMELLSGETLEETLRERGRLPVGEASTIVRHVLRGLEAAHAHGIVHRDVKPANIFLVGSGERPVAKLLDFGISGRTGAAGAAVGTPRYFAPEQTRGDAIDPRTDLWAVGITFYRLLTGRFPFEAETMKETFVKIVESDPPPPRTFAPEVPREIEAVVLRLLAKEPSRRYATAFVAEQAIGDALAEDASIREERQGYALVAVADAGRGALAKAIVSDLGLLGLHVRHGDEALDLIADIGMPELLVVDASLPRVAGHVVVEELRRRPGGDAVKVLAIAPDALLARAFSRPAVDGVLVSWAPLPLQRAIEGVLRGDVSAAVPPAPEVLDARVSEGARAAAAKAEVADITPQDEDLAKLVREVAESFGAPVALVSLVLPERQWFKAHVGLGGALLKARGTPIEQSFCRHVVASGDPLVVEDAAQHAAFSDNELVRQGVVGSYLGAPITTPEGHVLGSLCVIDANPHSFSARDVEDLSALARRAAGELALKSRPDTRLPVQVDVDAAWELSPERVVLEVNPSVVRLFGGEESDYVGKSRDEVIAMVARRFRRPDDVVARLRVANDGPFMGFDDLEMAEPTRTIRWVAKPHVHAVDGYRMEEAFQVAR
jgi:CheY-like chemotaxis protein